MKGIEAPANEKSYVALDSENAGLVDDDGLPLVYSPEAIQTYWKKQGGALQQRWLEFLKESVPFLTRVASLSLQGGSEELTKNGASLAKDAREIIQRLGPTYIKAGQMMSVRPDVLPQAALNELAILQDSVKPFATTDAISIIEKELGAPLGEFFEEISEQPVAAASLAQVYRAKLKSTGEFVAVKVQRPGILATVSKDLYVLRRAGGGVSRHHRTVCASATHGLRRVVERVGDWFLHRVGLFERSQESRHAEKTIDGTRESGGRVRPGGEL